MHFALQLAPVLAAEKSKVPFYIAGGVLVVWALFISMAVGMRDDGFPETVGRQRAVMAISVLLVAAAIVTAVVTGSAPEKEAQAASGEASSTAAGTTPAPETTQSAPSSTSSQPTATTGTPAPPSSPAAAPSTKLALAADPGGQLSYDKTELKTKAGTVTIAMENASPVEHNVTIAQGSKILGATPTFVGGKRSLTLKLSAGTYIFYCSVPGHKQAGMEGKLTVGS